MATHTWVDLDIPEAQELADLTGIDADLHRAKDLAQMLMAEMTSAKPNWKFAEPLSMAITVAYSRAFMTGVRARLTEADLSVLTPTQRIAHDRLRAYRDKHVAHSVNAFEENQPRAQYCVERVQTEGITSIGCSHARVVSLSTDDIESVSELADVLLKHVAARIAVEKTKLLSLVRSMPLDKVLAGGQKAFQVDRDTRLDRSRR
jgi:hypothetical protein